MTPTRSTALRERFFSIVWAAICLLAFLAYLVPGTGVNDTKTVAFGLGALALSLLYEILANVKESRSS